MLESECGTKWCPEWRSDHQYGDNRWASGGIFTREAVCIGTGYDDKAGRCQGGAPIYTGRWGRCL